MQVTCYYDYNCRYSYKMMMWLRSVQERGADLSLDWRTFSLREINRDADEPSPFDNFSSTSVLALALAHAARFGDFNHYHNTVFQAIHRGAQQARRHLDEEDLYRIAADAGVDVTEFNNERDRWFESVAEEHRQAFKDANVFGTPTLILNGRASVFLKLAEVPPPGEEDHVWQSLCCVATCYPELLEIKRPA
jgi:protein-disulfide isomerase-like protein with CxxC motif